VVSYLRAGNFAEEAASGAMRTLELIARSPKGKMRPGGEGSSWRIADFRADRHFAEGQFET
jgi:hypothetical protein